MLYGPSCPGTCYIEQAVIDLRDRDPSVSDSWVLRLKVYTITPVSDGGFIHMRRRVTGKLKLSLSIFCSGFFIVEDLRG